MLTVSLEGMRFYIKNGVYPEEKLIGSEWVLDVHVSYVPAGDIHDLKQTVDYQVMFDLVKDIVQQQAAMLLEETAQQVATAVKERFLFAKKIEVIICKKHPPLPGEIAQSKIRLVKDF